VLVALAVGAVFLGALSQATTGFGFSLIAAPFLLAAYEVPDGVQLNLVLSLAVNLAVLARTYREADLRAAGLLTVPGVLVTVAAGAAVRAATPETWAVAAGLVCLVACGAVARGVSSPVLASRGAVVAGGALSGGMNVVAGIAGPPAVLVSLNAGWPPSKALPTLQVFFLALNVVALAVLGLPDQLPLGLAAGALAGVAAGRAVHGRLADDRARTATLVLATAGSLLAVGRGLAALG
jgi:uncharacterized membrane protein YfcA